MNKTDLIDAIAANAGLKKTEAEAALKATIEPRVKNEEVAFEDLDLDSDPKYELLRDAILEKVVMLTISYFSISKYTKLNIYNRRKMQFFTNGKLKWKLNK